jgi:hypothetical protein
MGCITEKRGQGYRRTWVGISGSSCPEFRRYLSLDRHPWSPLTRTRQIMAGKRSPHLVVPTEQEWPVLGQHDDGALILSDGFVEDVEHVNGLRAGSLSDNELLRLLALWYDERRKIGFPEDPVMEHVSRKHTAA